jgi:RNA polymerase sigma-70 factor (ECF subfamily)
MEERLRASSDASHGHDLELVRRIAGGDQAELDRLGARLRCVTRILAARNQRLGRPLDDADLADLVQDVLVIIWTKLHEYDGLGALEGWVYRIATLEFWNALRRRQRRMRQEDGSKLSRADEAGTNAKWEYEDVHRGLERINGQGAEVIRQKHFEGRTFEEVAARLGVPVNTVKARYYRGLDELRPLLGRRGESG